MEPTRKYNLFHAVCFKLRGILMAPPIALLFFCTRWEWEREAALWAAGLSVFCAGVVLRVWAQRHLKYRLRDENTLAITGPYAWVRNPVYIGNMLIFAGLCVLCELPWVAPLFLLWAAVIYHGTVRFEEARLTRRFGDDYLAYRQRVPRWWPRMPRQRTVPRGTISEWSRAAAVEWQCFCLLLVPLIKELVYVPVIVPRIFS
jgi:protein-S-isoprenylcysteine O-methyltransferase Ste14